MEIQEIFKINGFSTKSLAIIRRISLDSEEVLRIYEFVIGYRTTMNSQNTYIRGVIKK